MGKWDGSKVRALGGLGLALPVQFTQPSQNAQAEGVSGREESKTGQDQGSHGGGPETQGFRPQGPHSIRDTEGSSTQQGTLWECHITVSRRDQEHLRKTECSSQDSCLVSSAQMLGLRCHLEKKDVWPQ